MDAEDWTPEDWDARYAAADQVWSRGPNAFVAAECAELTPGRAVDLAAGEGRNAVWLARLGWEVAAVDFSAVAVARGRRSTDGLPVTWTCADVLAWQPETPVDLVLLSYLHLTPGPRRRLLRSALSWLRVGGTLLLIGHDTSNLAEGVGGPQQVEVLMTAEDVLGDLDGLPHEVLRAERVARPVDGRTAWDCLVRVLRR